MAIERRADGFSLFFYGVLADAELRGTIARRPVEGVPASLADHLIVPAGRGRYPMIQHSQGALASGILCRGVDAETAARFSHYENEGQDYVARPLGVVDGAGLNRRAWVFLPLPGLRRGPGRWEQNRWLRYEKPRILRELRRGADKVGRAALEPHRLRWLERRGLA